MNTNNFYSLNILINKIIIIIFVSLIFPIVSTTLSFSYPTSITLDNGNLFIIHKNRIAITNPTSTEIIGSSALPEEITEEKYSKISIGKFIDDM